MSEEKHIEQAAKPPKGKNALSWIVGAISLIAAVSAVGYCYTTKLIPFRYLIPAAVILLLLDVLVTFLIRKGHRIIGIFLAVTLLAGMGVGFYYLSLAADTLNGITDTKHNGTEVCVYVPDDDPAQDIQDAKGYVFGTYKTLEDEAVNYVIGQLNELYGAPIQTKEADDLTRLIDELNDGTIDALLLPASYLGIFKDLGEAYWDAAEQLRILKSWLITTDEISSVVSQEAVSPQEPFTVYISGIDNRGPLIPKSLSDVNILMTVNPQTHKVQLISIPRDFFVPFSNSGKRDKLTHTGFYGIDVVTQTVSDFFDVDIDYYFRVNFGGFIDIIDTLGGVDVYSEYAFEGRGHTYTQGINHLDGESALVFSRERYAFASGDRQRGKNQLAVIRAVIDKLTTTDLLKHYDTIMSQVQGCFETTVPYDTMAQIVQDQLSGKYTWDVQTYSVDGTGSEEYSYTIDMNVYVMIPDESTVAEAKTRMEAIKAGK